jgi:hypothetical protein
MEMSVSWVKVDVAADAGTADKAISEAAASDAATAGAMTRAREIRVVMAGP